MKIVSILGIVFSTVGTILSLWTVLTTKTSYVGTASYLSKLSEQFGEGKKSTEKFT